ncbi:MAG: Ig-like domain-containing protein, partial [Ferruginibacter sp.]
MIKTCIKISLLFCLFASCKKNNNGGTQPTPTPVAIIAVKTIAINTFSFDNTLYGINPLPVITVTFTQPVQRGSVATAVSVSETGGPAAVVTTTFQNGDSTILVQPSAPLKYLTKNNLKISTALRSASDGGFSTAVDKDFIT